MSDGRAGESGSRLSLQIEPPDEPEQGVVDSEKPIGQQAKSVAPRGIIVSAITH